MSFKPEFVHGHIILPVKLTIDQGGDMMKRNCCSLLLVIALICFFILVFFSNNTVFAEGPNRPKIGLALSGGGSKGIAHIGVLKVLEEMGIKADMVAGTSMGSIIGGLYAAGYTPDQLAELVKETNWSAAFSATPQRRLLRYDQKDNENKYLFEVGLGKGRVDLPTGVISDYKLTALLTSLCLPVAGIEDFDRLPIPFRAVATDIVAGEKVVLSKGSLALAMRASMSIPSVFPPFELDDRLLIDGGVMENLPVQTVKDMGADVVIAVNVSSPLLKREELNSFLQLLDQTISIQIVKSTERQLKLADLVITPKVLKFGTFDFDKSDELIALGEKAARNETDQLMAFMKKYDVPHQKIERAGVTPLKNITVSKVTLDGPDIYLHDLKTLAPFKPGQKITVQDLDNSMQKLYGLGTFESVNYEVIPDDDGRAEIKYVVKEKPGFLRSRMGIELALDSHLISRGQFNFNFRRNNLFFSGSHADIDLSLGQDFSIETSMFLSNKPFTGFFMKPSLYYKSIRHDLYDDQDIRAEIMVDTFGTDLLIGQYLGTWGEIGLGYILESNRTSPYIVSYEIDDEIETVAGFYIGLGVDTLDRKPYPHQGFSSLISFFTGRQEVGADMDWNQLAWKGQFAIPLAKSHTIVPNWEFISVLNSTPPISKLNYLGGQEGMWGYAYEEFFGYDLARVQLKYRYEFKPNLYLLLGVNAGNVWEALDDILDRDNRWYWGGGAGLAFNSLAGPLEAVVGIGEGGRYQFYFKYGY